MAPGSCAPRTWPRRTWSTSTAGASRSDRSASLHLWQFKPRPRAGVFYCSVERFEAVGSDVLAHPGRVPDPTVHGDVHAWWQRLDRTDRRADVELRIRTAETRRIQRAGQDDRLVGN